MNLLRVIALATIAFSGCVAHDNRLATQWRALHTNCTSSPARPHHQVALSDATALFDKLLLSPVHRAQWLYDLGEWHLLYGGNLTRSEEFLRASADLGFAHAQFLVGALVATTATPSPAASAVYYHFASAAGSIPAVLARGYRHLVGYNAPQSCESALRYYKTVADNVMQHKHALPNRAVPIQVFSTPAPARLSDDQTKLPQTNHEEREGVEYLRHRVASSANIELLVRTASLLLFSDLYQEPTPAHADAQREAVSLLERASGMGSISAKAFLGHVHAYGLAGARVDEEHAIRLYEDAYNASTTSSLQDGNAKAEAANGLGMLYLDGVGTQAGDVERAMTYFQIAATAGHAEGVFNAARVMAHADPPRSLRYLEASAQVGHVGALFRLAQIKKKQRFQSLNDRDSGCEVIVQMYKQVAEQHAYGRTILNRAAEAFRAGRYDHSLRLYHIGAELGYAVAEENAAWLMERYVFSLQADTVSSPVYSQLVTRGVAQHSVDAIVRSADMAFTRTNYRLAMKQYLRAMELDPTHARALYSAGYMCEWGLGTVHNGRNLERARRYYKQAQRFEPSLAYALALTIVRIDVELAVTHWITQIRWLLVQTRNSIETVSMSAVAHDSKAREIVLLDVTVPTAPSLTPVQFASAMAFDGVSSSLTVETTQPAPLKGLIFETWVWIEKSPSPRTSEPLTTSQVLLEWPNTLRVEVTPHSNRVAWQLRVLGAESFRSVLTLTKAPLRARRWYRIALMVDATTRKVELRIDGAIADYGNLLVAFPHPPSRPVIHAGYSPSLQQGVFHGKFLQYRISGGVAVDDSLAERLEVRADNSVWIDLHFDVRTRTEDTSGGEKTQSRVIDKQKVYASEVTTHGVDLRMVQLPPNRDYQ